MEDRDENSESEDTAGDVEESLSNDPPPHNAVSNIRQMRNEMERNRRNKLNSFIANLSDLLPKALTTGTSKKLDKTSILRLSAAYLRKDRLLPLFATNEVIPPSLRNYNFMSILLEDENAICFVLTLTGKIVSVSHTVESILGHTPTELLGKSLFEFTCPDDHDNLRQQLTPDVVPDVENEERALVPATATPLEWQSQRRRFYLKLRHRSGPKDQTHYEIVTFDGELRIPLGFQNKHKHAEPSTSNSSGSSGSSVISGSSGTGGNPATEEAIMVAIVKLVRKINLHHDNLLEANKLEYITRHTMDGRIIFCDQRISIVSGYLPDEVVGLSAFNYMHRDDVPWTVVALKQMFSNREDYGSSCYRLKTRNNEFIYLKTFGYLERDRETDTVDSFICINILITDEEGVKAVTDMKTRFSAQFELMDDPLSKPISNAIVEEVLDEPGPTTPVPKKEEIEKRVNYLLMSDSEQEASITDEPMEEPTPPTPEYSRVTKVSKSFPKASIHAALAGITHVPKLGPRNGGQSPRTPQSPAATPESLPMPMSVVSVQKDAPERPSVVCGPRNVAQPSMSGIAASPTQTTPEAVRTSVISGHKRSYDASNARGKESPKKKCSRTRAPAPGPASASAPAPAPAPGPASAPAPAPTSVPGPAPAHCRQNSEPSALPEDPTFRLGFTQTQGLVGVDDVCSPDLGILPVLAESSALLPGYHNGGWTVKQRDALNHPEHDHFQVPSLETSLEDPFVGTQDLGNVLQVPDNSYSLDPGADPQEYEEAVEQLHLQHYKLGTCIQHQTMQVTNITQSLQHAPADASQRQLYEDKVVQLKVEHTRQEKMLQELTRETRNIQRDYLGAQ